MSKKQKITIVDPDKDRMSGAYIGMLARRKQERLEQEAREAYYAKGIDPTWTKIMKEQREELMKKLNKLKLILILI